MKFDLNSTYFVIVVHYSRVDSEYDIIDIGLLGVNVAVTSFYENFECGKLNVV